jgi:CRISPR-associated endonuclease/helicase Cas3
MIWLYLQRGYSDIEMAERLGVDRTTVFRDRSELETEHAFCQDDQGRYRLERMQYMPNIKVNLHEALALYLATRRASRQTRIAQPHTASALEKLAVALKQPMTERLARAAGSILEQSADPERVHVLEVITQGWAEQRKVSIIHRALKAPHPRPLPDPHPHPRSGVATQRLGRGGNAPQRREYVVCPYLIEPSLWSDGAYVIGYCETFQKVATFKIERIEKAELKLERFSIPEDFDEAELLRYAWGIWYGENEPVTVRLRFAEGEAARRVRESIWHPTQVLKEEADGGVIWQAQVAEWQEMLPWVRGWGADVEVVEPAELREELKQEAQALASVYRLSTIQPGNIDTATHHLLWAKFDKRTYKIHRLIYHLIDVRQMVLVIWQQGLNEKLKQEIAGWLQLDIDETGQLIAFWAALHDLGKASPAFQDHTNLPFKPRQRIRLELKAAGFKFPDRSDSEVRARHEIISSWILNEGGMALHQPWLPDELKNKVTQVIGGHHGSWPPTTAFDAKNLKPADTGIEHEIWTLARCNLIQDLVALGQPPAVNDFRLDETLDNVMLTLISGIISVADWLGSNDQFFPFEEHIIPLESYTRHSWQHALYALLCVEWKRAPSMPDLDFERAFGFTPNLAQREVSNALNHITLPALAIIEAPMGSGKTEAALAVYAQWAKDGGHSGLYVAMPTTATSNQMYGRVEDFVSKQFGVDIKPLLVHSQAPLRDLPNENETVEDSDGDQAGAQAWFLPHKKSLLAPFGVGTVDQALMSILQTKHFFVRLLGLSNKIVIFDEVHAYDAYMSELFEQLLIWLRKIGASVIVLSATLPEKTRQSLIRAFTGDTVVPDVKRYPRVSYATADGLVRSIELTLPPEKTLDFDWIERDEETIIQRLEDELKEGGCAAVICNTVGRAQKLYHALKQRYIPLCDADNLILFHARFPLAWREELEQKVLDKFGPNLTDKAKTNSNRPSKAIVISTQVIEQSLDLDFDVMISDHAPIDLLLQRAGRLQRHQVNAIGRKHPYRLSIAKPNILSDLPQFERGDTYVYDEYILLRSWLVLKNIFNKQIHLPSDLDEFIKQVYSDDDLNASPELKTRLDKTEQEMRNENLDLKFKARRRIVPKPDCEDLLWSENRALEEDDPSVHETFWALTRSERPGVNVVCLHHVHGRLQLEPDDSNLVFDVSARIGKEMVRELARHAISVRHPDPVVEQSLLKESEDAQIKAILKKWKKIAALRYHRVVIFEGGVYRLDGTRYVMRLDKNNQLGMQISKEA